MIAILLVISTVFLLVAASELLWRHKSIDTEYSRKFIHITVGSFVALWPLFLTKLEILILSLSFVAAVLISNIFGIFKAIHSIERPTYGEVFFALAVGLLALVAHGGWIYLTALLHMSLADGLAAVIGVKYGEKNQYKVWGHTKSIAGTLTFILVSLGVLTIYALVTHGTFSVWFVAIALAAGVIENAAPMGLDNLLVPVLVALALNAQLIR